MDKVLLCRLSQVSLHRAVRIEGGTMSIGLHGNELSELSLVQVAPGALLVYVRTRRGQERLIPLGNVNSMDPVALEPSPEVTSSTQGPLRQPDQGNPTPSVESPLRSTGKRAKNGR